MKRFTKVLLALVFVLGAFLPFAGGKSASATGEEKYIVSSPAVTKKTESVYLKTNQNGSQTQISAKEFEVLKKEVKSQYNKNQKEVIYNTGSKNFTSKNDIKPNAPVNVIKTVHDTIFDATKSTITMTSTIQSITGTKPVIMLLGRDLYNGKTVDGAYSRMVGFDVEWTGAEIFAGQKATKVYTTTSTNFWISTYNTSVGWTGSYPSTSQGQTVDVLANKKAAVYPVIRNTHNNTYMWKPSIANMAVVPVELRTKRDYALPSKYKTWYIRNYGDPKWDWTTLQIHHELPLKYGGNNTMGNLFPLPTTIHQKTVTPWWASY